jgi:uncharacterized protein (TIGR02117 family)
VIKRIFGYFLKTILLTLAVLFSWLLSAFLFPYLITGYVPLRQEKSITIFVESNGVHTDFILPVKCGSADWSRSMPYSDFERADPGFQYVSIGWGDKGFFIGTPTWADLTFSTAFNAAFGLGTSAMHVTYKRNEPKESEHCRKIRLSPFQYKVLSGYITNSFRKITAVLSALNIPVILTIIVFMKPVGVTACSIPVTFGRAMD